MKLKEEDEVDESTVEEGEEIEEEYEIDEGSSRRRGRT